MDVVYHLMNRELAPYQGFPHHEAVEPQPASGMPIGGHVPSPDAGGPREVLQARRQVGDPSGVALAESTPQAGGLLLPPVWAGGRRR